MGALGWGSAAGASGFGDVFDGVISDLVIFDKALSPADAAEAEAILNGEGPVEEPIDPPVEPEDPAVGEELIGDDGDNVLEGGDGDDLIEGGAGKDTLTGNGGADQIYGGADFDIISGGDGQDYLDGGERRDTIHGGNDDDVVIGAKGWDRLMGDAGDDSLEGNQGRDRLFGGDGADVLDGGAGVDTLEGGAGADEFVFRKSGGFDTITDFDAAEDVINVAHWNLSSAEEALGFAIQIEDDTLIDLPGNGGIILLEGVNFDDLTADNILF